MCVCVGACVLPLALRFNLYTQYSNVGVVVSHFFKSYEFTEVREAVTAVLLNLFSSVLPLVVEAELSTPEKNYIRNMYIVVSTASQQKGCGFHSWAGDLSV